LERGHTLYRLSRMRWSVTDGRARSAQQYSFQQWGLVEFKSDLAGSPSSKTHSDPKAQNKSTRLEEICDKNGRDSSGCVIQRRLLESEYNVT
jgi:hypothetical protein